MAKIGYPLLVINPIKKISHKEIIVPSGPSCTQFRWEASSVSNRQESISKIDTIVCWSEADISTGTVCKFRRKMLYEIDKSIVRAFCYINLPTKGRC